MSDIKIRTFKGSAATPSSTVTIPGGVFRMARRLIPNAAVTALREQGIELDELARLSESPEAIGRLIEIEDHERDQWTVIALE